MKLDPNIIKMRDALLERIGEKPLKEVGQIVNEILINETNHTNRLAALAARVKILREYINKNYSPSKKNSVASKLKERVEKVEDAEHKTQEEKLIEEESKDPWVRVKMIKSGIVNGVRFPEGVIIDVSKKDADKLVQDELSEIIDENDQFDEKSEQKKENKIQKPNEKAIESKEEITEAKEVDTPKEEITEAKEVETPKEAVNQGKKINESKDEGKKIIKTKSTKITEETIELTDPKAVAEALGLNEAKKKAEEPKEIEEEIDLEAFETGRKTK